MNVEKVIMETNANTTYVLLGFPAIPLWLTFVMLERIKGHNLFYSLKMTFLKLCQENSFIVFILILELIVCLSYYRMHNQKITLTDQRIIIQTLNVFGSKIFETTTQELQLTDIDKIYVKTGSDFFERRLKCSTIILQPDNGEEIQLFLMNNGKEFTELASYHIAMSKRKSFPELE